MGVKWGGAGIDVKIGSNISTQRIHGNAQIVQHETDRTNLEGLAGEHVSSAAEEGI